MIDLARAVQCTMYIKPRNRAARGRAEVEQRLTARIAVILWGASRGEAIRAEDGTDGWLSRQCKN